MKIGLLTIVGLLCCCWLYSQKKALPTEEELQAMIKKIQKQADQRWRAACKGKTEGRDGIETGQN
jgi:hypothetical protein